jgi:hypothetical protein
MTTYQMTRAGFGISSAAEMDTMMRVLSACNAGPPAEVAIKLLIGNAAGLSVGESLSQVTLIKGRPTVGAAAQLAIIQRAGVRTRWIESTDRVARLRLTLPWDDEPVETAYTMDEAKAAGLTGSENYRKHAAAMLRARCITTAIRMHCPGLIGGAIYDPEEIADPGPARPSRSALDALPPARPALVIEAQPVPTPDPVRVAEAIPAAPSAPPRDKWEPRAVARLVAAGTDPDRARVVIAACDTMQDAAAAIAEAEELAAQVATMNQPAEEVTDGPDI